MKSRSIEERDFGAANTTSHHLRLVRIHDNESFDRTSEHILLISMRDTGTTAYHPQYQAADQDTKASFDL